MELVLLKPSEATPPGPIEESLEETFGSLMALAEKLNLPFLDLSSVEIDREAGRLVPEATARKIDGVVVGRSRNQLTVVSSDPTNIYIHDHIEIVTRGRYRAFLVLGDARQIALARRYVYTDDIDAQTLSWHLWLKKHRLEAEAVEVHSTDVSGLNATVDLEEATSQPIVEAVNGLIREALALNASDIHFENQEEHMVIRFRLDGVLHPMVTIAKAQARPYIQRLKIMAEMDITNEQLPEGGRMSLTIGGESLDMRASLLPSRFGENAVLRLLNRRAGLLSLEELGMSETVQRQFRDMVTMPHGMVIVCGPTGSGKSTTLYAALQSINSNERKIITVEDPVECVLPGVTQVQVNLYPREESRRLTFAGALREFLRHDPDVVMVGEMRDEESAAIATQAALTGHLVFSTLHTNDSLGAIARLKDLGVEPYAIASTLLGVLAQRLVRKVCLECAHHVPPDAHLIRLLQQYTLDAPSLVVEGRGCADCRETGFLGRVGLFELLPVNEEIRALVEENAPAVAIGRVARALKMITLFHDGLMKTADGITTFPEVRRVTSRD